MARLGVVGKAICIVSGGQTGVDRAGLAWAMRRGFEHGGWCPKGRRAEDGEIPTRYKLTPDTAGAPCPAHRVECSGQRRHGDLLTIAQAVRRFAEDSGLVPGIRETCAAPRGETSPFRRAPLRLRKFLRQHHVRFSMWRVRENLRSLALGVCPIRPGCDFRVYLGRRSRATGGL